MKEEFNIKTTNDTLFKGKLKFTQPKQGFRFGVDALLLAASVPAKDNQHVLDMGCGVGTVGLCVAYRCQNTKVTGIEIQPHFAGLARQNAEQNEMTDRITILDGDISKPPSEFYNPIFDHVVMNPPYMKRDEGNKSPDAAKEIAHTEVHGNLKDWIKTALRALKVKGTISIIHRTDRMAEIITLLEKGFGDIKLIPLWPRENEPSKRIIIQAVKGSKAPLTLTSGLIIHEKEQRYTAQLDDMVNNATPLDI